MDSVCGIVDYDTDDDSIEESPPYNLQLLPEGSPVPDELPKAPICPRTGEEYQVEVPDFLVEPETIPADNQFLIGLPVPLTWLDIHENDGSHVPENGGHVPENGGHAPENGGHVPENGGHVPETDGHVPEKDGHVPVPGIGTSHWNETEAKGLVLGLYIFGKNLRLITRFVASKSIGDVLAYYYGVFYKSETYKKWVDCRKARNRKCIVGTRIFTGWRQQELVSRLQLAVPQEKHEPVLEAIKSFNDNIFTFEDFVFFLRSTIGLQTFVDAVAIGKGIEDLTGPGPDSGRAVAHPAPSRSEVPSGKACSSLSPTEIIKFLTGDFRLSKARANDLFWEAIWPRLLARGWHSEQPRDLIGSKNSLVFLLPGVKKFSRKLTKGVHYYDCVSDVLKRVAAEPELLEIDNIMAGNVDGECVPGTTSVSPKEYLRPKSRSQEGAEFMRFMVVDTSMLYDEKKMRVRDFKSLPSDINLGKEPLLSTGQFRIAIPSDSSDSEDDKQSRGKRRESGSGKASNVNLVRTGTPQVAGVLLGCSSVIDAAGNGHVESTSVGNNVRGHFGQFSRSSKPKVHKYLSPVPKRQRLSGCKQQGASQKSLPVPKGNSNEAGPDVLVLSATAEEGREGEPPRRRRKIKFLVKDVMKEVTSELELGSSGSVEAVQKGDPRAEPVPLHNSKEVGASTSTPPRKKKVREPKVARNDPNNCGLKMAGDQTKIEFDSSDEVTESVERAAPTKRKRKVTFLFREAVQSDDNAMPHFFNGSVTGTLHGAGVSKKPKLPIRRKPKPSVKEVKKETELVSIPDPVHEITQHEKIEVEMPKPQPVEEEPKDLLQPNVPETAPTDVGTSGTSNAPGPSEPNAVTSGRRTGTRKRPPTERSLLAVAYGFLEAPKQRNVSASPRKARKSSGEASRKRRKMEETVVPVPSEDANVVVMGPMVAGESSQGNTDQPVVKVTNDTEPKQKTSDHVAQVELST